MGRDINGKTIVLIIIIVILVAAAGYLTYLISNDENPLVLFNSQASEAEEEDPLLAQGAATPTPTVGFTSTSPTSVLSPSPQVTTPLSPTTLPITGANGAIYVTATPSPIGSLPAAGVGDFLQPAMIGGGILILLALLL